jgi:hypothetical protein
MINLLAANNRALLKSCLTFTFLALGLMFGPVLLNPDAQANPDDKDKSQKPGVLTPAATGAISGIVTEAATSAPIPGVQVNIFNSNRSLVSTTSTDSSGVYTTPADLATGTYYAVTSNSLGYLDELYDNINCLAFSCDVTSGTPIAVTDGATTTGINFALAPGGRISGTVIDAATSAPIANVFVQIRRGTDGQGVSNTFTDGSGNYVSGPGLPTGTYYAVTLNSLGYVDEFYDNIICFGCSFNAGTPISVTVGATTPGINFALDLGGRISGRLTDAGTGEPIANGIVNIYNSTGSFISSVSADSSGNYMTFSGVPAGSCFVRTFVIGQGYVNELYDNIPCPVFQCDVTTGTPIPVTAGATTPNIDFALIGPGEITGTVTDAATNMPLADIGVDIYNSNDELVGTFFTDSSGNYTGTGLISDTYYVVTSNTFGYIDEVYDNIACVPCDPVTGTPIPIAPGETVPNINFALSLGGSISGNVINVDTGAPIENILVLIFNPAGQFITSGTTDLKGEYITMRGLPTGTYYARTSNAQDYINELYKDIQCLNCDVTSGTPITVTAGLITSDIKFTLQKGGRIIGTVTNAVTQSPVGAFIEIFDSSGNLVTFTSGTGSYITSEGLPTGTYYARTFNFDGLFDAIYNSITCFSCDPTIGTAIPVTAGLTTPNIDFALCPSFSLSQSSRFFGAIGGEGGFTVTSTGGCGWAAVSDVAWIEITSNPISPGNGHVTYLVRDNLSAAPRTGEISAANKTFTVTQEGRSAPDCTFEIDPQFDTFDSSGGFGTINVLAPVGCAWRAETNSSWITLSAMCCDIGFGSVAYTVAPNLTGSGRSAVIRIAGKKFNVKQK